MFKKLVSNLAFSPSSIDQISFYAKRLKQENSIRRLGLVLIVFSMFLQMFAAMIPPEKSLAASNNDVIRGGIDRIDDKIVKGKVVEKGLRTKVNEMPDVKALYNRFGLQTNSINTTGGAKNVSFDFSTKNARTVGRVNLPNTADHNLGSFAGSTFYSRAASNWSGSTPAYAFGEQRGTDGVVYEVWVIKDCGNIVYRPAKGEEGIVTPNTPNIVIPPTPTPTPTPAPTPTPTPAPTPPPVTPPPTPEVPKKPEPVCENNPALKPDDERCKCVDNPKIPATDEKCATPGHSKSVTNLTQKLNPAQTAATKAKAGDSLEYTLTVTNRNVIPKTGFVVEDFVGDLLDYADIDTAFLAAQGGTFSPQKKAVIWENQTIPAKGELKKNFRVTLKSTIPSTNQPNTTANDYDCKMENAYGNSTVINVDCPVLKTVETLPNTGPGTTIAVAFTVSVVSGYFFMRGRLLAKEVSIIKKTQQQQAGY